MQLFLNDNREGVESLIKKGTRAIVSVAQLCLRSQPSKYPRILRGKATTPRPGTNIEIAGSN